MSPNDTANATAEIEALVREIGEKKAKLAALRQQQPRTRVAQDYVFTGPDGATHALSSLFGSHDQMVLIHHMGVSCNYCMLWADGLNGVVPHMQNRAAFVVVSPDKPETNQARAKDRGWRFEIMSHAGTSFSQDMGFADADGESPGVSTFVKDADGSIWRIAQAPFGPGDDFAPIWHLFDLLPPGREWGPKQKY